MTCWPWSGSLQFQQLHLPSDREVVDAGGKKPSRTRSKIFSDSLQDMSNDMRDLYEALRVRRQLQWHSTS